MGDLTFLAAAFARSRMLMGTIFARFTDVADQAQFLDDLFDFFRTQPEIRSKPSALPAPRPIRDGYEFRNVSFAYPGSATLVLDGVSFRFSAGERIALIGENGAGKTTLTKLLARLYDPDRRSDPAGWRGSQRLRCSRAFARRSASSFRTTCATTCPRATTSGLGGWSCWAGGPNRHAARKARADVLIEQLPLGYDQMLGGAFDGGIDLSAGQWQKIALARAYMRDAQVLVLDEPTASLDARAEYEVFQQFTELTRGKMAVLISHRFSTVRMADRILVLENGRILEQGTHPNLFVAGGRYAELFELQAAGTDDGSHGIGDPDERHTHRGAVALAGH